MIAAWQALDARTARTQAQLARDEAQAHEQAALVAADRSATAATRSADALEEANEIERSKIPTDQWLLKRNGNTFEFVNISSMTMFAVDIMNLGDTSDLTPYQKMPRDEVGAGESVIFLYERSSASGAQTTVELSWGDRITGKRSTLRKTIS